MGTVFLVILAIGAGFGGGALFNQRRQMPAMRELGRYRTHFWRSDINEPLYNVPGTKFRFSLDGRKSIWWAIVAADGTVGPSESTVSELLPYIEGPGEPVS